MMYYATACLFLISLVNLSSSNAFEDVVNSRLRGGDAAADVNTAWWDHERILQDAGRTCPYPDSTNLSSVWSGQYGSVTGDCYYMYWDPIKCNMQTKCPLYVYVDGTEHGNDIDDRDTTFMKEMAARGYVAVAVDYDDRTLGYTEGCSGFSQKSKKIFDDSVKGSVLYQLCKDSDDEFGHRNVVPVDCNQGVAVNGWSQGSHVAALANNFSTFITAGLFWGNGNFNTACYFPFQKCLVCIKTDVSCMNSNQIALPKEKRRYINGEKDSFFGACQGWFGKNYRENVIDQLQKVSGRSCSSSTNDCMSTNKNQAGYFVVSGQGHNLMDLTPNSYFMDSDNPWGLKRNFDWLAKQGRL